MQFNFQLLVISIGLVLTNGNVIKLSKPKAITPDDEPLQPDLGSITEERVPINIFSLTLDDIIRDLNTKADSHTIDSYFPATLKQDTHTTDSYFPTEEKKDTKKYNQSAIDNSFTVDLRPPPLEQSEPNYYLEKQRKNKKYNRNEKLVNIKGKHNTPEQSDSDYDKMDDPFADFIFDDESVDFDKYGSHEIGETDKSIKSLKLTKPTDAAEARAQKFEDPKDQKQEGSKMDMNTGEEFIPNNQRKLDVVTQNGPDGRMEFQMHGYKGPLSYKFGYDTGKGYLLFILINHPTTQPNNDLFTTPSPLIILFNPSQRLFVFKIINRIILFFRFLGRTGSSG